jgi:cystathionine beta-lyase
VKPFTRCVHFDPCPDDPFRPTSTPIYQTATFAQDSAVEFGRYDYSRSGNPTRAVLEAQLARLENATHAFAFASGMAALTTLTRLVPAGAHILAGDDLYGGTWRLLEHCAPRSGLRASYVDAVDPDKVASAMQLDTHWVLIETPTNPLLRIVDIRAVADVVHRRGRRLAVDNSLCSPWLQRPLELGADLVVHSATKHLCGHGDVTAGVLAVRDEELAREIAFLQNAEGNALGPFDSWLLLRGLKTLGVRQMREEQTAGAVALFLHEHARVTRVHYPGLAAHADRDVHFRQASGASSVISFETGSPAVSRALVEALRLFTIAVSFGSTHSTASLPCWMSHKSIGAGHARALPADLVRLSIGLEDADDLIADIDQAFHASVETPSKAGSRLPRAVMPESI